MLLIEQSLNGLQLGVMLFLLASGLTLVLGIMNLVNLAHGSLYMLGAFIAASVLQQSGNFALALVIAVAATALAGLVLERSLIQRLYKRDHLDQVLATFGLILTFNEGVKLLWGPRPMFLDVPAFLSGSVEILPGLPYPAYRLALIVVGLLVAVGLALLIQRTKLGMLLRAGASNRRMLAALGVDVTWLYASVFALGAGLAALAGALAGPIYAVEVGMGERILILTFVVIIVGGIGSVRGAFLGALLVGLVDTLGRAFLPGSLRLILPDTLADGLGASLASVAIYLVLAAVLIWRPRGLFPAHG